MDAEDARRRSLVAFSESVESHLEEIDTEIGQNLGSREVKYMVVNAWRDYVDLATYYPAWCAPKSENWRWGDQDKVDLQYAIEGVFEEVEEYTINKYGDGSHDEYGIYLGMVISIALRTKGYDTDLCDDDCCGSETDDSHIIVNW